MAEREELQKRYAYHEMSNKVEMADPALRRNRGEPTGEVESLRGRTEVGRMGDRVVRRAKPDIKLPATKKAKLLAEDTTRPSTTTAKASSALAVSGESILELGNLTGYQPTTERARAAYENMLTMIGSRSLLGSQAPQILRDAVQEVITLLKDPRVRDPERHADISKLLTGKAPSAPGGLPSEQFAALVQLGKQLDDYYDKTADPSRADMDEDPGREPTRLGSSEDIGVAVVFDESEEEEDNAQGDDEVDVGVVVDASSDEDDDAEEAAAAKGDEVPEAADVDEDKLVQGVTEEGKKKSRYGADRKLTVHEIDAHFLQRQLSKHFDEADAAASVADQVLEIIDIRKGADRRECENRLVVLLGGYTMFDTITLILNNRVRVWACVSMKRSQTDEERNAIEEALAQEPTGEGKRVWDEIHSKGRAEDWTRERMKGITDAIKMEGEAESSKSKASPGQDPEKMDEDDDDQVAELDLENLAFAEGSHTMSNKTCVLPETAWRATKKGYEEVHVPAVRTIIPPDEKLISIKELPSWAHAAFKGMDKLNRIQSKMCDVALYTSENLLLCAPTGAGKTNVACLTMLNILGQHRHDIPNDSTESMEGIQKEMFDLQSFKIVYVAPMKALVQEVVKNFSQRLKDYGVVVRELSGDSSLTRQQIAETQLIVTTPEKWDVVTRQGEGRAYTQLVKLVIIDEIHLLHDERGPVLESIVARIIRQVETTAEPIRLVGLSATLPNYADVAAFLRVKPDKGLFFFDHSYRPVPLQMQYIGITERNAFKRFQLQNEICYEKAIDQRKNRNQILIFVHSRSETGKTAKALRDLAIERDELSYFVRDGGASQEILREESSSAKNQALKEVLPYGFAIHHAGMAREDRELVEDLFADHHIAVLCTTATLAWGVNLPAHAVIIRGTQIYDPSKGRWTELSPLDVLQMLGRAGRPQYDSEGEGIILTQHSQLQFYLSLTNLQLPVESQLIKSLPDHLNAEIVLGTVQTLAEAAEWLCYTFLFVRMLQNLALYGLHLEASRTDPSLKRRRRDLAHTAACVLEKSNLIRYDRKGGMIQATPLGRVASQYYISHTSMVVYTRNMRQNMSDIELFRLFSLSGEFSHITVREDEKLELTKLASRVPIPVKESPTEPSAKVNILLQAYISRLKLEGFALVADMAFIQQSAARIMRALFEISLRKSWASNAKLCLDLSNMVAYRVWSSQTPLRLFKNVPEVVARKLERKSDIEWARFFDLTPSDLGELVGVPKMGRVLHKLVQQFPRMELAAQIQPITRSLLRVELTLSSAFQFDVSVHGYVQLFHVIVEDVNGESILYHETFPLKSGKNDEENVLDFTVPILEPLQPAYFVRVISDRWLHSEAVLPILFNKMILPAKFLPPTDLLDLQPLLPTALGEPMLAKVFNFKEFNPIQTQTFHELFKTDRNCLVCSPPCSGKSICAIFAILRMLVTNAQGKCVYVAPIDEIADRTFDVWSSSLGRLFPKSSILRLSGESSFDFDLFKQGKVLIASARQWDMITRRWRQRKIFESISLMIFDELQFLGGAEGPLLEVAISRTRYMSAQLSHDASGQYRFIGLSASLANARDVGEWMGVPLKSQFNFSPRSRPLPMEIFFHSFEQSNYSARLLAMSKPVYNAIAKYISDKSAIVFVPSRRQAQLTAIDIMTYAATQQTASFLGSTASVEEIQRIAAELREPSMQQLVVAGIAFLHNGMLQEDWDRVIKLYERRAVRVLVCPAELCWKMPCVGHLVVVMDTQSYDGREGRHVDYPIVDLLHMIGRFDITCSGKCVLMCHSPKKEFLKKLLYDALPVESHLSSYLHDPLNSEIVTKTVSSMQDAIDYLTWTFLYRRLSKNPTYYGLQGTTNVHVSEYLSEMVETVVGDLVESKCCESNEDGDLSPLNLGMISAYYYVQYRTIELIASSLTAKTKIRGILEILSASWEYASLPIRFGEEKTLKSLAKSIVHKLPENASFDSNAKALILLQCHFSRTVLPSDLRTDLKSVLKEAVKLIQAVVDVISSNGWLRPALAAMEMSQMIIQGLWNKDNVLKQIPHFNDEIITRCQEYNGNDPIESVFDILTLDDDVRDKLLQLPQSKMADVAVFCNNYPNVEVKFSVEDADDVSAGNPVRIAVELEREIDEDDMTEAAMADLGKVSAPFFPFEKREGWWLVVGEASSNSLLSLKRINLSHRQKCLLEFIAPSDPGDYEMTLFCMSDSYLGCDQEYSISLSVAAAPDEEDDDDDEDQGE